MRIALVSHSLEEAAGGTQRYVADLARELARQHEVLVLTGLAGGVVEPAGTVRVPAMRALDLDESAAAKAVWHLRDQWLPTVHRVVARHLRRFAPDVVHTHAPQGLSAAVFTAIARVRVPHVHTTHDLNLLCTRVTMTRGGEFCGGRCASCLVQRAIRGRLVRRHLQRLVAPSDYYRVVHVRAGLVAPEHAVTIPQAARPGLARARTADPDNARVGFIGALAPHKGVPTLLAAFAAAPSGWRLSLAGAGPLAEHVASIAALDRRIDYVGYVDGARKERFYDALDLLVIPSEWEENAPLVAAEAAVRGLPSVVSNRGGLPETPEACIFRARDPASLIGAIRSYVEPPGKLEAASRRLLARRELFLWEHHARRVERVLEETVAEARDTRRTASPEERARAEARLG